MFCTWRATVCSLMTSSEAISRLLFPAATRRSTSSSRGVSPCVSREPDGEVSESTRRQVGPCPELLEDAAGTFELERRRVLVAQRAAGHREQDTNPRGLVGRLELLPGLRCPPQRDHRGAWIPLGQLDRAAAVRRHRTEHSALVGGRDLLELVGGAARLVELPLGKHDLDERRQQRRAAERSGRLVEHTANRSSGRIVSALGEPELRQSRLGLPAVPTGRAVRLLGGVELPEQAMQLRLPVVGLPGSDLGQPRPLRGLPSLLERSRPGTAAAAGLPRDG